MEVMEEIKNDLKLFWVGRLEKTLAINASMMRVLRQGVELVVNWIKLLIRLVLSDALTKLLLMLSYFVLNWLHW